MEKEIFVCCICGRLCNCFSNNPTGAMWKTPEGKIEEPTFKSHERCCSECNDLYVIPGRIYKLHMNRGN